MYIFSVTVEGGIVNSNMDGFSNLSGNLFSVMVYSLEVEDVGARVVVEMLCL